MKPSATITGSAQFTPERTRSVHTVRPKIEISEENLHEVATLLNTLLADEYVLYTKTRNAHWNIQGQNFIELHAFFQEQYQILDLIVDDIAERVRSLGHFALGTCKDFLAITHLLESHIRFGNQQEIIKALLDDHETIICTIRTEITPISEKYKDLGTTDFVTGIMQKHEKMAWMLRAFLAHSNVQ